jgi:hypothetical protein
VRIAQDLALHSSTVSMSSLKDGREGDKADDITNRIVALSWKRTLDLYVYARLYATKSRPRLRHHRHIYLRSQPSRTIRPHQDVTHRRRRLYPVVQPQHSEEDPTGLPLARNQFCNRRRDEGKESRNSQAARATHQLVFLHRSSTWIDSMDACLQGFHSGRRRRNLSGNLRRLRIHRPL